jgi:uncharacterized delta-60 repeat protein
MKANFMKLVFLFAITLSLILTSFAASPGALDFSFSNDGKVLTNISVSTVAAGMLVQPDDKILTSGTVNLGVSGTVFYVARFTSTGALDTTFNSTGVATIDFAQPNQSGCKIALQSDGKIVLAGTVIPTGTSGDIAVARLNNDGSLDTTFDSDGKAIFSISTLLERFKDLDIAPDGKIVITDFLSGDYGLLRITTDGVFDTSFNGSGFLAIDFSNTTNQVSAASVQPDGKIIVVGTGTETGGAVFGFGVVRVNTNGTFDTTFSGDGKLIVPFSGSFSRPSDVEIQPNGSIVVAGGVVVPSARMAITRVTSSGSLDTTFDTDGKVETDFSSVNDLELLPNGKISTLFPSSSGTALARFNSNGSFDSNFGNGGIIFTSRLSVPAHDYESDGKLLMVGGEGNSQLLTRHTANIQPTQEGDFDGDAFTDSAVYRPSTGNWFILNSATNTVTIDTFGANGDIPIGGDFDGDGRSDVSIFRPSDGTWFFKRSSDGSISGATFGRRSPDCRRLRQRRQNRHSVFPSRQWKLVCIAKQHKFLNLLRLSIWSGRRHSAFTFGVISVFK